MTAEIVLAFLVGWMLGTWMSWRKILKERRRAETTRLMIAKRFSKSLFQTLQDEGIITLDTEFDQEKFDQLLGNRPTKH